jgi:hypothetical protein
MGDTYRRVLRRRLFMLISPSVRCYAAQRSAALRCAALRCVAVPAFPPHLVACRP